ncbi:hypothetical protein NDU88_000328 [Pleurodeles waltl]|uniref:Uncharacterized protein n=1 Tax=Pleurodeles waltl TaxID=8319 RepID=A0AAV7MLP6_PLEWA|nr:hypothetical protein NDU88_000328 [Pleurodeles waltl]
MDLAPCPCRGPFVDPSHAAYFKPHLGTRRKNTNHAEDKKAAATTIIKDFCFQGPGRQSNPPKDDTHWEKKQEGWAREEETSGSENVEGSAGAAVWRRHADLIPKESPEDQVQVSPEDQVQLSPEDQVQLSHEHQVQLSAEDQVQLSPGTRSS